MLKFEDAVQLQDFLDEQQRTRLARTLSALTGSAVRLDEQKTERAIPIEFNLETIGWLSSDDPDADLPTMENLVSFVLMFVAKYRLAANLHNDVTEASYVELQRRNEALAESEARYRELSEELQKRVDEQVAIIHKNQQELYESARLRSVGHLAAGVAHEINNPIGFISSNLGVATEYLMELEGALKGHSEMSELLTDFRDLIKESSDGARRISTIVADLKTFSSIDQAHYTRCDVNDLLKSAIHLVGTEHGSDLPIALKLNDCPALMGHPARLSQAFFNLVENSVYAITNRDSSEKPGRILVTTEADSTELRICVQDNGCGIPDAQKEQVLDAFFTTRPVGAGTGLGLTVVQDTVRAHKGQLSLDSREGIGTRVTLSFPLAQA